MVDIGIIGAGVCGSLIAREFAKYHCSIVVMEKESDVATGSSGANSGIVHAGFDAKEGSFKARFNVKGSKMMKRVTNELGVKYKNNGTLVIGFGNEDRKIIEELYNRGIQNGVESLSVIGREQLIQLEPNSSKDALFALYAPTGGIVSPYGLNIAALGNAMDNGVILKLEYEVVNILKNNNYYSIYSNQGEKVDCRYCINAAGIYSDAIARMIGDDSFHITPKKGEYLLLDKECGTLVSHTVFHTPTEKGKGILVSPTVDGNLLLGPTSMNLDDKENTATTLQGIQKIISESMQDVQNIPQSRVITSFAGLRAAGDTGDFIINMPTRGFVNVAGIESPGLTSAPAIAEYVRDMLFDNGFSAEEKTDFNPFRVPMDWFYGMSLEEKNKVIAKDRSYGKIVCRCERISEGELLYAMCTNPKAHTVDGAKRRTRAGMGRCGGGFCLPRIMELLAVEQKIPFEKVTKCGGESYYNIGRTK